jgi:YegS/Rv2252/BmrU family lipid kinase
MKKTLLVINPVSGKTKSKSFVFEIVDFFCKKEYDVSVKITQQKGHALEIAKEFSKEFDMIVCCGGDGTVNEILGGIMLSGSSTPVGYLPMGSTNDFASTLGLAKSVKSGLENIFKYPVKRLDIGLFNKKRYFSYIASFGLFSAVSYNVPQNMKNTFGYLAYVLEGMKDISNIKPYHIIAKTEELEIEDEFIFGAVANSTSVGGIMHIKDADVDLHDGLFEVMLIRYPKTASDLHKIIFAFNTSNFSNNMIEFFHTSKIEFNMPKDIPWSLDGEYQQGSKKIVIENNKNAINFLGIK